MKKTLLTLMAILLLLLTACGTQSANETEVTAPVSGGEEPEMDTPTLVGLGILELDGTANEVTPEQAAVMLPLWKAMQSLADSETITEEEMNGLYNQVADELSSEQMDAIHAMELTGQSFMELAQKHNLLPEGMENGKNRFADMDPEMQATAQAARESGERPEGFTPGQGGGLGRGGGQGELGVLPEGPVSEGTGTNRRLGVAGANPFLIEGVIAYLNTLIQ